MEAGWSPVLVGCDAFSQEGNVNIITADDISYINDSKLLPLVPLAPRPSDLVPRRHDSDIAS